MSSFTDSAVIEVVVFGATPPVAEANKESKSRLPVDVVVVFVASADPRSPSKEVAGEGVVSLSSLDKSSRNDVSVV